MESSPRDVYARPRWIKRRRPTPDIVPMRYVALIAAAALIAVLAYRHDEAVAQEARLAAIASDIARRDVRVHCQGAVGEALDAAAESGSVAFDAQGRPADVTDLKRPICTALAAFPERWDDPGFACLDDRTPCSLSVKRSVVAVHALAHEAWHLAGYRDEAVAECYALQTTEYVAERLGAAQPLAQALAVHTLERLYPTLPPAYRTPDCRDAGRLDLRRATRSWP